MEAVGAVFFFCAPQYRSIQNSWNEGVGKNKGRDRKLYLWNSIVHLPEITSKFLLRNTPPPEKSWYLLVIG